MKRTFAPRFDRRPAMLTDAERQQLRRIGTSARERAKLLGMNAETVADLLSPYGRAQVDTVERVRARLAELAAE